MSEEEYRRLMKTVDRWEMALFVVCFLAGIAATAALWWCEGPPAPASFLEKEPDDAVQQ